MPSLSCSAAQMLTHMAAECRPYVKDAQRLLSEARARNCERICQHKIDFLQLPIHDGATSSDHAMHRLAQDCCERILAGEVLYVHCWGGHGRTGTLVSIVAGRLYGMTSTQAMDYCQRCHDSRVFPQATRSPQTVVQRAQVRHTQPEWQVQRIWVVLAFCIACGRAYDMTLAISTKGQDMKHL